MQQGSLTVVLCVSAVLTVAVAGVGPSPAFAAKSLSQCRSAASACKKNCDATIIDVGHNIQDCKSRCDDKEVLCTPSGGSSRSATGATSGSGGSNGARHGVRFPGPPHGGVKYPGGNAPNRHRPPVKFGGFKPPSGGRHR
jgi:hypothetical protein